MATVTTAAEAVVIPNHLDEAIVANEEGEEEVMIGPQEEQQQQGAPTEIVQLWEEVAYGLEKNQTGKSRCILHVLILSLSLSLSPSSI